MGAQEIILVDPEDAHLLVGAYVNSFRNHRYARLPGAELLHRVIAGAGAGEDVDHLNGNTLDNRRANLRVATRAENCRNSDAWGKTHGYRGVVFHRPSGLFTARIKHHGETISLKYHKTAESANVARLRKEKELWGILPRRLSAFQEAGLA